MDAAQALPEVAAQVRVVACIGERLRLMWRAGAVGPGAGAAAAGGGRGPRGRRAVRCAADNHA